ncbi:MAG: hypothetical protein OHM56_03605 [Spiroplasma phoeniceum]|nr:MAG: hypothetical protein OHM57_03070 [Spiroplasma phoeniceum]UZQ33044.1 MAG: hypothetical protein OHM56_03605 [Spiroplasma phoeniceum]
MLSNYTYSKYAINKGYNDDIKLFSPYYFELISNTREVETGYWEFENCKVKLNSSYFNFTGCPTPPTPINYWDEVYLNDKPFNQIDNKWYFVVWRGNKNADWRIIKFKNNEMTIKIDNSNNRQLQKTNLGMGRDLYITNDSEFVKYVTHWTDDNGSCFKSVYCWNNDSKPNTPFILPKTGQITDWNLKNQRNIENNDNKIKVSIINNDISENKIYQLEANYFNWLPITNELETNNIPSLITVEIKLSDGEYGKYLTNLIISNDKIE